MSETRTSNTASEMADQILRDLSGATFYADPHILAGVISTSPAQTPEDEQRAVELIRLLLRAYSTGATQAEVKARLVTALSGMNRR